MRIVKVISGGQTGADSGALVAARRCGVATGGWAPHGWWTERGPQRDYLRGFGLRECEHPGYPARTRRNVISADATLLLGRLDSPGCTLTLNTCEWFDKPVFCMPTPIAVARAVEECRYFLQHTFPGDAALVLNVAGNRESKHPGIHAVTMHVISALLSPHP